MYADMEEMDLENEHDNTMLDDEEDEDEDDDDEENPLRLHNDDDEDIETEYEPECFDRVSDDFVLNNRLKQHHKERSLSLQDLSTLKNNIHSYNKKRHSLNIFRHNYLGIQQNPILYPVAQKRQMMKYQHVESKVKQYIRDIKEQNRKSMEKRMKEQEFIMNKNHNEKTESKKYICIQLYIQLQFRYSYLEDFVCLLLLLLLLLFSIFFFYVYNLIKYSLSILNKIIWYSSISMNNQNFKANKLSI